MAQQVFSQYVPLARTGPNPQDTIPVVAAIAQTRDGKDELLHGTVPFVPAGGLYVPVSAANRLPVEATLSGRTVTTVTPLPRAVRGSGQYGVSLTRPSGAVGCIAYLNIYGVTGTFAAGEGIDCRLYVRSSGIAAGVWGISTTKTTEAGRSHVLVCYPGARREDGVSGGPNRDLRVLGMPATQLMLVIINITGTFSGGEGIDCEMVLEWLF